MVYFEQVISTDNVQVNEMVTVKATALTMITDMTVVQQTSMNNIQSPLMPTHVLDVNVPGTWMDPEHRSVIAYMIQEVRLKLRG